MILQDDGPVIYSASDLTAAAACEWALMHRLDARLGRVPAAVIVEDDMLMRTAALGDAHELAVLAQLKREHTVVEIERPERPTDIAEAAALSAQAFLDQADVVYQAAFFDGRFLGYADFIQKTADGAYEVFDTKLARKAKITALLQLAAYSEQLEKIGIPTGERVHLILGDGKQSSHRLADILPVYRRQRARLQQIIDERVADPNPTDWRDPRYAACGRCDACTEQVELHRDVLLTAGLRLTQRARLADAGVLTIEQLAERREPVEGVTNLRTLQTQAAVQLESTPDAPAWRIGDIRALGALPHPDDGDIFFDFEGDPLYQEGSAWGLDYLFGLVEADGTFVPFWAHDLAQERLALIEFLDYVRARRAQHPLMHIYHYASYERTHLLSLAARHGYGEEIVADLLRNHVLVDLYPVVKRGLIIGSHSYSLKKLEPLYMSTSRVGTANAADSVSEYVRYTELVGRDPDAAAEVLDDIARYNAYDCLSTRELRDWLLARADEQHVTLSEQPTEVELDVPLVDRETDPLFDELSALVTSAPSERTPDETAIALAAAAIDYHRRENNSFWWDHFDRLRADIDDWADTRDVFVIDDVSVVRDWSLVGRARNASRELFVTGTAAPGSAFGGSEPFLVYDAPLPPTTDNVEPGARWAHNRVSVTPTDGGLTIVERVKTGADTYDNVPVALTPAAPPRAGVLVDAIHDWGTRVRDSWPELLPDAALDVLRRIPPRGGIVRGGTDTVADIRDTLLRSKHSYVAVQGPPGTGKTFTGSRVIVDLVVNHGWKVGVVAQSHAAVENMLDGIVKAGLDPELVGKIPKQPADRSWTELSDTGAFTAQDAFVLGGTAWTFANAARIPRGSLDLLVIDEAGQYSLANTIAASSAATRLLLLGDPQQLPQVSQGQHPEPVDVSALGWLSEGHDVLPPEFGFFLETSWRMHAAVCAPVSRLSYEGRLTSHASDRYLAGIEPGLHSVPVEHWNDSTSSQAEADAVVALIEDLLGPGHTGRDWCGRPLEQGDVIVVAPYNAQVGLLRETLETAGLYGVPVGTVDKFQGQEAAVAIVSMAASSAADVPRGIEFLLLANRLNVAISRAQWAAYIVYSPALTEFLPTSVAALAQLSAFIELVGE